MPTAKTIQEIKDNMVVPESYAIVRIKGEDREYHVCDIFEDDHYLLPETCMMVVVEHFQLFMEFMKNLPDMQQFADGDTLPYWRDDTVVGPGETTRIFYKDVNTERKVLVGYDDYPVICLELNSKHYVNESEKWTAEDKR
ncbi:MULTISPECIES: hypothetical protein [unclassified Psychrobacillus]|uniref:hypothetical protein n=1 Tax=unclassified Psychrobacillus TaxID=2636677 RepID=UPI0030F9D036